MDHQKEVEQRLKDLLYQRPAHFICDCQACIATLATLIDEIVTDARSLAYQEGVQDGRASEHY
jgi:hypothetical protein